MRKILLILNVFLFGVNLAQAAPCYGTRLPQKNRFIAGFESYSIFKHSLEDDYGKLRSQQEFFKLSYGVAEWLSLDLKSGAGNLKHRPPASQEITYTSSFAGGYGFRVRLFEKDNWKAVGGFQHISVHPKSRDNSTVKHQGILDDWQFSFLGSYGFEKITPYLGARWSDMQYIHTINGERHRATSDSAKTFGVIYGADIPITENIWLNLEGQALDTQAFAGSINYSF